MRPRVQNQRDASPVGDMTVQQIAIAGSSGRMGRALLEAVFQAPDMRLHAALEQP